MSKDSAAWLIVRTLGLLLLIAAIWQIFQFGLNIVMLTIQLIYLVPTEEVSRLVNLRWDPLVNGGLYAIFAYYFLRKGEVAHTLLMVERSDKNS